MSAKFTVKDWILISSYLDEKLSPVDGARLQSRLKTDPEYKMALDEMAYTRRMLRSLPQKRAPRNFTLSQEEYKARVRRAWFQPALSFVSIASMVLFVFVFAGPRLFSGARSAAPMMASAPEAAVMDNLNQAAEKSSSPMIINWNPVMGIGGGGGDGNTADPYFGGGGVGGAGGPGFEVAPAATISPLEPEVQIPTEQPITEEAVPPPGEPQVNAPPPAERSTTTTDGSDLSTLILGIPDPSTGGQVISSETDVLERRPAPLNNRSILMIVTAIIAVFSGAAAVFLYRR